MTIGQFRKPKDNPRQTQTEVNTGGWIPDSMQQANESLASVAQNPVFTPEDVMGYKDKLAPKVDFNMPVKEEEEVEEVKAKNPLEEIVNTIKPMTAEEEEKRKRGAMSASAIAHLGNMMGALGNVINVNKGAVPQTSPTVKSPDITSFEEKVRKQREAHADRLYKIDALRRQQDKEDWTRKQAEAEFELKKQTAKYNNALNALKMQVEQGKLTAQEYDNEVKRINAKFASLLKQAELNRTNAQTRSYDSSAYASTERGRYYSRGGSGSKNQPYEFSLGGKTYTVNKNRWNDANKSELLRLAGSDGYVEYEDGTEWNVKTGQDEPVIKRRRMTDDEALRYAINHVNDATRRYLDWLGGESESEEIEDEDEEYAISEDGDAGTSKKDYAHYKR